MKKAITVLCALAMVFGIAGMAWADACEDCDAVITDRIFRGCGSETVDQYGESTPIDDCTPFDFNDTRQRYDYTGETLLNDDASYCGKKDKVHRAIVDICECEDEWNETVRLGDTIDITMEILVDGEKGNNGIYWAQNVETIGMTTDVCDKVDMCDDDYLEGDMGIMKDWDGYKTVDFYGTGKWFKGPYTFTGDETEDGTPYTGDSCVDLTDDQKVTKIEAEETAQAAGLTGYAITQSDINLGACVWGFDIPAMRHDPEVIVGGETVQVEIKFRVTTGGSLCKDLCTCIIDIGTMCCDDDSGSGNGTSGGSLLFPYATRMDSTSWWYGIAVTNTTATAGTANIIVYESDGDIWTLADQAIGAGKIVSFASYDLLVNPNLVLTGSGPGTAGDKQAYIKVTTTGFMPYGYIMIVDGVNNTSSGYLGK